MVAWSTFLVCAAVIVLAGTALCRYGDVIAEQLRLGRTWFGLAFVASITSLPELVTGVSSAAVAGQPDLALGDALGSCVFNLGILGAADLVRRERSLFSSERGGQRAAALAGMLLLAWVAVGIVRGGFLIDLGGLGGRALDLTAPVLFLGYGASLWLLLRIERAAAPRSFPPAAEDEEAPSEAADEPRVGLRRALLRYALSAAFVVAAGAVLPFAAEGIARAAGWELSFVGTTFVALSTSLPEVVVTVVAIRLGSIEIAVGNLLGSNLFNLAIVGVDQVVYAEPSLLADASPVLLVPAVTAALMSGVVLVALRRRPATARPQRWVGPVLVLLLVVSTHVVHRLLA